MVAVLEVFPFPGEPARVEVLLTGLGPEVAFVTVTRTAGGLTLEVRGAVRARVAGALTKIDFDVPPNVQVTYRAELFDDAGLPLGFTSTAMVNVPSVKSWMHNPLHPQGAVAVSLVASAAQSLSRPYSGQTVRARGRRVGQIVTSGVRSGLVGLVLDVRCETLEDADKVQALLGEDSVPVICFRKGTEDVKVRVPTPLYVGVFDIPEEPFTLHTGGEMTTQRIQGDEAEPPVPGLFIPLLTRADVNAYYATRAAVNADNATRLALNRRYDLAGSAG